MRTFKIKIIVPALTRVLYTRDQSERIFPADNAHQWEEGESDSVTL